MIFLLLLYTALLGAITGSTGKQLAQNTHTFNLIHKMKMYLVLLSVISTSFLKKKKNHEIPKMRMKSEHVQTSELHLN